jgi:hypothetical protein
MKNSWNRKLKEGPIVDDKPPTRTRIPAPTGDIRPGLPTPTPRRDVTFTRPQATTSAPTGLELDPQRPTNAPGQTTGGPGTNQNPRPSFDYAKLGQSTTITPGFNRLSPSGRGMPDQKEFTSYDPAALRRLRALRGTTQ